MDGKLSRRRNRRAARVAGREAGRSLTSAIAATRARLAEGAPLLLLLDLDGTLADFKVDPGESHLPASTRQLLRRFASAPRSRVVIVTGRTARNAARIVGVPSIDVSGMHGQEFLTRGRLARRRVSPAARVALDRMLRVAQRLAADLPGSRAEDKRPGGVSFHTRGARQDLSAVASAEFVRAVRKERRHGLELLSGKSVVEAKIAGVNKGTAAGLLAREASSVRRPVILFAGDDATDEYAHRALRRRPDAITIVVSRVQRPSAARFRVKSIVALLKVLESLATHLPRVRR